METNFERDLDEIRKEVDNLTLEYGSILRDALDELADAAELLRPEDGVDGIDGIDGKNGRDGKDGKDGKDGVDGIDGKNGRDGKNGVDGAPAFSNQAEKEALADIMIDHVNSMSKVIEWKSIKNTPDFSLNNNGGNGIGYIKEASDVNTTGITNGQTLIWNSTKNIFEPGSGSGSVSPLTTRGDIYTYDSANARLPVGTDGQILIADSTQATGLRWGKIGLNYLGIWDADTNTPTITSGVGIGGDYYIVSVAGTTTIDGISDWEIGDWIIFNDETSVWQKIDTTSQNLFNTDLTQTANRTHTQDGFSQTFDTAGVWQFNTGTKSINIDTDSTQVSIGDGTSTVSLEPGMVNFNDSVNIVRLQQFDGNGKYTDFALGANSFSDSAGTGSPETVIAASKGSSYRDLTNGLLYIKNTGIGNTGWKEVSTVRPLSTKTATYTVANTDGEVFVDPAAATNITLLSTLSDGIEFGFSGTVDSTKVITWTAGAGTTIEDPITHLPVASFDNSTWIDTALFSFQLIKVNSVWRIRGL